jgi:hypothetical protein
MCAVLMAALSSIANIENMYVTFQRSIGGEGLYANTRGNACDFFKRWVTSTSTSKSSIVPKKVGKCSVADPGCLSPIPDPDFYPSRIPDPKTATKDRGEIFFLSNHLL